MNRSWIGNDGSVGTEDGLVKDKDVSDGLDDGEGDRGDTGPLIDFSATSFTVLRDFFERWDSFSEKLDNNRSGNVRRDTNEDD